jgi:YggT family protein
VQNVASMGGTGAIFGLLADFSVLADLGTSLSRFVSVFVGVYILLVFAYVLTSWIRLPYSPTLNRIQRFLYDVCDPYLRLFRRVLPPIGGLDLSPIVAVFVLVILQRLLNALLESTL